MKRSTIHLSLPAGSQPPEAHVQVDASTVAYLTARATAADTSMTVIASMILAANAAAAAAGRADITIEFNFALPGARDLSGARADVRALTQVVASCRLAIASRSSANAAEREERAARLAALDNALTTVAATLTKLESLCGLSASQMSAEFVTRALTELAAAAPTAPGLPSLPPSVSKKDAETFLHNHEARAVESLNAWVACALAAAAIGKEFRVPRPAPKPQPAPSKPTPPATPPASIVGAVDKLAAAAATAKPEGAKS